MRLPHPTNLGLDAERQTDEQAAAWRDEWADDRAEVAHLFDEGPTRAEIQREEADGGY